VKWSRYAYRTKEDKVDDHSSDDESEAAPKNKPKRELIVEARSGTLTDFLDEFEAVANKQVVHRSILDRQKSATIQFDRERRPGILGLDMDFAENYDIEEARKVQSEHWSKKSCTLFIVVLSWLDVAAWDREEGDLSIGAEVTVNGEKSGSLRQARSYWARIIDRVGDIYAVENSTGNKEKVHRKLLRHRVYIQQCHAGVTADKQHDSWSMQFFVTKTIEHLRAQGTIANQKLRALCVHSDNAKQHFKSSKSLFYFTSKLGFESALWDFGAPGHGKGVWDGLGGMLKQWLRKRSASALSFMHRLDMETPISVKSAKDCFEAWKSHFESEQWRARAREQEKGVTAFYFHWADDDDDAHERIMRPLTKSVHATIEGISSSYQFFMFKEKAEVLMRGHSCWCEGCFAVATAPASDLTSHLNENYVSLNCVRRAHVAFYEWANKSCRIIAGPGADHLDQRAKDHGHQLAAGLRNGDWVLIENYADDEDEVWLGRTVPFFRHGDSKCCVEEHTGSRRHIQGVRFDPGDFKIAVQWYERLAENGDGVRLEFQRGSTAVDLVNSTELRLSGFDMDQIDELRLRRSGSGRVAGGNAATEDEDGRKKWRLKPEIEQEALRFCR
jgi:hypothetical protein